MAKIVSFVPCGESMTKSALSTTRRLIILLNKQFYVNQTHRPYSRGIYMMSVVQFRWQGIECRVTASLQSITSDTNKQSRLLVTCISPLFLQKTKKF